MGQEIERKFLVAASRLGDLVDGESIQQGYIATAGAATVRLRIAGGQGWLTLKGPTRGTVRSEFEYPVPAADAGQMIAELCDGPLIAKTRYRREYRGHTWEIDVFEGDNAGLIVAEVALSLVLLSSTGLLIRSLGALHEVELGYETEGIVTFAVEVPDWGDSNEAAAVAMRSYTEELENIGITDKADTTGTDAALMIIFSPIWVWSSIAIYEGQPWKEKFYQNVPLLVVFVASGTGGPAVVSFFRGRW